VPERRYDGDALDGTVQYVTERPELEDEADEVAYATAPDPPGEATTENVPVPGESDDVCGFPGCTGPTEDTYCEECRAATRRSGE
jgi:hypothetical protein